MLEYELTSKRIYSKIYYLEHKKEISERKRGWYISRKESGLLPPGKQTPEYQRNWYAKNKDKMREYQRKYEHAHPEVRRKIVHKYRTKKTLAGGSYTVAEWDNLCRAHEYKCVCCGQQKSLHPDHVVPVSMGGTSNIDNIQPLCTSCNTRKKDKTIDYRQLRT
jgi:5-methylcytosine-specific restriction endonuclease McrA